MEKDRNVYTIKQVNSYVKRMFEDDFVLRSIYIKGEISNLKYHSSGHVYFSLKDDGGVIACVMFASYASAMKFRFKEGMQVVVYGSVSVYEKSGSYQVYVKSAQEDGRGELYRQFEELKARLEEEGLFSDIYKKPIPRFCLKIGIVTARTGAVIRDIYNVSSRRNPYSRLFLYPAQVQGEGAADTIVAGIEALDKLNLDCIIVGRGGGSIEDLWCFNEEKVARAIFNCNTPIISAVGHETDFTIADFAADLRAPTPSAAAELAALDYNAFLQDLDNYRDTFYMYMENRLNECKNKSYTYKLKLEAQSPANVILREKQYIKETRNRLDMNLDQHLRDAKESLKIRAERLNGLSPLKRLAEGYSFVTIAGEAVKKINDVNIGDKLVINVSDGQIGATVDGKRSN